MLTGTTVTTAQLAGLRQSTIGRRRRHSFALQLGQRQSRLAGSGLQMREVRQYQAGDDLRHIHWKATAKAGEPLTRVFEAENELSWLLVIILTPDMYFGSQHAFKSVRALEAAALLAWECMRNNDAVGSLICSPHGLDSWGPVRTRRGLLMQLDQWARHSIYPDQAPDFDRHFARLQHELQYLSRPHRPLTVFSDFLPPYAWDQFCDRAGTQPATLVQVYDPLEVTLPTRGTFAAAGHQGPRWIQSSARAQQRYTADRRAWFDNLQQHWSGRSQQWVTLSTQEDPELWAWPGPQEAYGR